MLAAMVCLPTLWLCAAGSEVENLTMSHNHLFVAIGGTPVTEARGRMPLRFRHLHGHQCNESMPSGDGNNAHTARISSMDDDDLFWLRRLSLAVVVYIELRNRGEVDFVTISNFRRVIQTRRA
jgi:hypothetical protein